MTRLTDFVLRHRLVVALFWLAVTVVGVLTVQTTTGRLSQSFSLPNSPAASTEELLAHQYHSTGANPDILVFGLPAGQTVDSPGAKASLARASAAAQAFGGRVVDYPSTGDRAFTTADGRTAYAYVFVPQQGFADASSAAP